MVLINEEIVGKQLDKDGITSNQHALKYGIVLIKYYRNLGLTNDEIKVKLKERLHIEQDASGTLTDYLYNTLVMNMNICGEFKNKPIGVTAAELDLIHSLNDKKLEQFIFAFLVLCRSYNNRVRVTKAELMRMARLPTSSSAFDKYFDAVLELGYMDITIRKYKVKDISRTGMYYYMTKQITDLYNENDVVLEVRDSNDPVLFYWQYFNIEQILPCEDCNTLYVKSRKAVRGRNLCPQCRRKEQNEAAKMRMRRVRKQRREQQNYS